MARIVIYGTLALLTMGIGGFIMLRSLGVFGPIPDSPDGPIWLGVAIGFVFFAGGSSVMIKAIYGDLDSQGGGAPAGAPVVVRVLYYALGIGIVAGLGALFTWIAIGPGERQFSGSGAFLGPWVGRAMFGLGALMTWFFLGWSILRWIRGRGETS
jgi:hypothetical protein